MKTPPMMLGAAAVFWGAQTGLYLPAAIVAAVTEGPALVDARVALGTREYRMIWSLCALVFLAAGVYTFAAGDGPAGFFVLVQWLPLMFLPMAAAQLYGAAPRVELAAFSLIYRNTSAGPGDEPEAMNLTYPYLAMIIGSASAANVRSIWFYLFMGATTMWALWTIRPRSHSAPIWAASLLAVLAAGYGAGVELNLLQAKVEKHLMEFYARMFLDQPDPFTTSTSIGEVGALKTSSKILYRLESSNGYYHPVYLPISSYNIYRLGSWHAMRAELKPVAPEKSGMDWSLAASPGASEATMKVSAYLPYGEGLLPIPLDGVRLSRLPAHKLFMSRLGTVKAGGAPEFVRYGIHQSPDKGRLAPPDQVDLQIPKVEEPWIMRAAGELGLEGKSPAEAMSIIKRHFDNGYGYTLDLKTVKGVSALEGFFYHTKAGHCEYYAVATVMLLRAAGIPARYFAGFLAHEYSAMEGSFIVRQKDAHAWPMAYIGGRWVVFDTTPSSWIQEEHEMGYTFERPYDLLSFLYMRFARWMAGEGTGLNTMWLAWLLIPLILYLAWRAASGARLTKARPGEKKTGGEGAAYTAKSAFYLMERRMEELGFRRWGWETEARFFDRALAQRPDLPEQLTMDILRMHYRLRFDPAGLTNKEMEYMMDAVLLWIEESRSAVPSAATTAGGRDR